jgi:hypothetical protein
LNSLKEHIYNSIKYESTNRNYLKKLNKSIWIENDNSVFLEKIKKMFIKKSKHIEKKMKKVDIRLNERLNSTIPTEFLNPDFDRIDGYDPIFLRKIL